MTKRKLLAYFVMAVVFALSIVIFIKGFCLYNAQKDPKNAKRLDVSLEITPVSNNSLILSANGMIVEAEEANIKARGMEGNILWSLHLEDDVRELLSCGRNLIVVTKNNNIITIDKSGKKLWQHAMPITPSTILSDDGNFLLIQYNWPEYNLFEIFDIKGIKLSTAIIDKAHVLSFSSSFGKCFTVSLLDLSSDKVLSKVATYNNKGEILWANNYENVILPKIKHGAKDNIIVVGENFIKKFKADGKLLKELTFNENFSSLAMSDSLIIVVIKKNDYYDINSYDLNFKQLGTSAVRTKPKGIFAGKDEYLLFDKDNLSLSNKSGKVIAIYEPNFDINNAYIHDDGNIYIISNRKLLKLSR